MFKITAPIKGINGPTTFGTVPVNFMDSVGYAREVPAAVRAYLDSAGYKVEQTDADAADVNKHNALASKATKTVDAEAQPGTVADMPGVEHYRPAQGRPVNETDGKDDAVQAPAYAGMNVDEFVAAYTDADTETRAAMLEAEKAGKARKGIAEAVARIDAETAKDGDTDTE